MARATAERAEAKPAARADAACIPRGQDVVYLAVTAMVERKAQADQVAVEAIASTNTGARVRTEHLASAVMAALVTPDAISTWAVVAVVAIMAAAVAGLAAPLIAVAVAVVVAAAGARPTLSTGLRVCASGKGGKIQPPTGWSSSVGSQKNLAARSTASRIAGPFSRLQFAGVFSFVTSKQ